MNVIFILIICVLPNLIYANESSFCESQRKDFLRVSEIRESLLFEKLELFFQQTHWIINDLIHR